MNDAQSVSLGQTVVHGTPFWLTDQERARHIYTIGRTGAGKSTFQRSLVLQDIRAGRGVCLIDPHGDNAQWIAGAIPRHRMNETIYFDAADREWPIGINPLSGERDPHIRELIASEMLQMFKSLFSDSWGPWLEYLLKHTLLALLARQEGAVSLLAIQRMLEDEGYREHVLRTLRDPALRRFWLQYFEQLQGREQLERISSTINKTGKFELSTVLRHIVGQTKSGFDFRRVVDEQKILIVNLNKGQIGADNANFLGSLIVSMIVGEIMRRGTIPEAERVPFHLTIDEFQNFTTSAFADIVSESRKYGLRLCVAHQTFDQVDDRVLDQILKNAEVLTAFGVSFEDADRLMSIFRPLRSEALSGSGVGEFWARTTTREPVMLRGFSPELLELEHRNSLERVRKASRWRHARPVKTVEQHLVEWYGS